MIDFKIRCSAINSIMTKPKKDRLVSAGAETYCKKWYTEQIYGRKEEVSSKYMFKGNSVEDESIEFIGKQLQYKKLRKNYKSFENDFMTGTPDVITKDEILEVKNSWNCFTFPLLETEIPNKGYFYQAQGYMHLSGLKKAKLIYTLMDTPEDLIEKEFYKSPSYRNDIIIYEEFKKDFIYNHLEDKYRIKIFEISYDKEVIENIIDRVKACRKYIETIKI